MNGYFRMSRVVVETAFYMKKYVLLVASFGVTFAFSQKIWHKGSIVTGTGRRIEGYILKNWPQNYGPKNEPVSFKTCQRCAAQNYPASTLKSFVIGKNLYSSLNVYESPLPYPLITTDSDVPEEDTYQKGKDGTFHYTVYDTAHIVYVPLKWNAVFAHVLLLTSLYNLYEAFDSRIHFYWGRAGDTGRAFELLRQKYVTKKGKLIKYTTEYKGQLKDLVPGYPFKNTLQWGGAMDLNREIEERIGFTEYNRRRITYFVSNVVWREKGDVSYDYRGRLKRMFEDPEIVLPFLSAVTFMVLHHE